MEVSRNNKHPRNKAQFWQQEIAAQGNSGISIPQYCQQRGLSYHTMQYWRRIFRGNKRIEPKLIAVPVVHPKILERSVPGSLRVKFRDMEIEFSTMPDVDWLLEFAEKFSRSGRC